MSKKKFLVGDLVYLNCDRLFLYCTRKLFEIYTSEWSHVTKFKGNIALVSDSFKSKQHYEEKMSILVINVKTKLEKLCMFSTNEKAFRKIN